MKRQFLSVALLTVSFLISCTTPQTDTKIAGGHAPRVFLLDAKQLQTTKQRIHDGDQSFAPALAQLEREAKQALPAEPFSVVSKTVMPPSRNKHDYMSQAPYYWPNPATSNGLPFVRRDGERNPDAYKNSDRPRIGDMGETVETLALAYYFCGDEVYATKATQLIRVWFLDPTTRMNPNLQFAQAIPGINTGRGAGLIESRYLTRVVDAVGLLAGSKSWTQADQRGMEEWFVKFLRWMLESKNGQDEAAAKNNHGTYYDIQIVSFALFLGETEFAKNVLETAKEKRIAVQIEPDGRQPLELARTKAWGYSVGNLAGLMYLATLGEGLRIDLWHYETTDGRSIPKALDYLTPFALGEEWPHQQLGGVSREALFPLIRRAAVKYPQRKYRDLLSRIPAPGAGDRNNLLRPKSSEQEQRHE